MSNRQSDAELLTAFLAGRDVSCPRCRYNLRDLTGSRCPECGLELQPGLATIEKRFAWTLLVVSLSISLGAGLTYWSLLIQFTSDIGSFLQPSIHSMRDLFRYCVSLYLLLNAPLLPIALFLRKTFFRQSPRVQKFIAFAFATITLAMVKVLFFPR